MKLYHGDASNVLQTLGENSVDLVVTSPPYYNAKEYINYKSIDVYMRDMQDIFEKVLRVLKPCRMAAVNISCVIKPRPSRSQSSKRIPLPFYYVPMLEAVGFEFVEDIIWKKPEGAVFNRNWQFCKNKQPLVYKPNLVTEYILVFRKPVNKLVDKYLKNTSFIHEPYESTNVWEINPQRRKNGHPCPFPYELPYKLIQYYSYEDETVLDPFAGEGTTLKAAQDLRRDCIGIEINPEFFRMLKANLCT